MPRSLGRRGPTAATTARTGSPCTMQRRRATWKLVLESSASEARRNRCRRVGSKKQLARAFVRSSRCSWSLSDQELDYTKASATYREFFDKSSGDHTDYKSDLEVPALQCLRLPPIHPAAHGWVRSSIDLFLARHEFAAT